MNRAWIGILLEVFVADVLVVLGLAGQKLAVMQAEARNMQQGYDELIEGDEENRTRSRIIRVFKALGNVAHSILLNWKWVIAMVIFILGQAVELVALMFASQTQVVAMGNFGLPWNALVSVVLFKEDFRMVPKYGGWRVFYQWDLFAMLTLIVGATMTVSFSPSAPDDSAFTAQRLLEMWVEFPYAGYGICMLAGILGCSIFMWRNWKDPAVGNLNAVLLGMTCALISSFTVTMSKVTTILLHNTFAGDNQYDSPGPVIMTGMWLFMLVASLVLLNVGLSRFEQGLLYPIYAVSSCTFTIVSGILYYQTYNNFGKHKAAGFITGIIIMATGIWLTSLREFKTKEQLEKKLQTRLTSLERLLAGEATPRREGSSSPVSLQVSMSAAALDFDSELEQPLVNRYSQVVPLAEPDES